MSFEPPYRTNDTIVDSSHGGTGMTNFWQGELIIGKADGTLNRSTLSPGANVGILNGDGSIVVSTLDNVAFESVSANYLASRSRYLVINSDETGATAVDGGLVVVRSSNASLTLTGTAQPGIAGVSNPRLPWSTFSGATAPDEFILVVGSASNDGLYEMFDNSDGAGGTILKGVGLNDTTVPFVRRQVVAESLVGATAYKVNVAVVRVGAGTLEMASGTTGAALVYNKLATVTGGGSNQRWVALQSLTSGLNDGGALSASAWTARDLNTIQYDAGTGVSFEPEQLTLTAGTYYVRAYGVGYRCGNHKIRFLNATAGTVLLVGNNASSNTTDGDNTLSSLEGVVTIGATSACLIQHWCSITNSVNGGGATMSSGSNEVYAMLSVEKIQL